MKLTFNKTYAILALSLLIIEGLIALFIEGGFIRYTFGDFLVVILMYCALKCIVSIKIVEAVIIVWLVAFVIECLQLTNILQYFKLDNNNLAKTIFGTTFHFSDLIAYTLGCFTILIVEHLKTKS